MGKIEIKKRKERNKKVGKPLCPKNKYDNFIPILVNFVDI